jgi:RES domain-containing protein
LYVAPTIALAMLETSAHVRVPHLPLNRYLVEIDVPDEVWARRRETSERDLPVGWDAIPHGVISTAFGDAWLLACGEAVHLVPSSIVPEEPIVLINPRHGDATGITAKAVRKIQFAALFR